tara:strand:- start:2371 stop:3630 length:1260 start_codon:yes stop_codon:yes gene_type:complete
MAERLKPIPKRQERISQDAIETYNNAAKQTTPDEIRKNRGYSRSVKGDTVKQFSIGLRDIDETIVYYFNNVIKPSVVQNSKIIQVPVLYGSPERWASVQKDGFYRDKNGKIQTPLIMFKRETIEKNRALGNKLDANNVNNFGIFEKKYSRKNIYDNFSALTNRIPVKELYGVIIPDYVNITYSCIIFTEYVEQMNKIVESINFASDAYWGDPQRFNFRAMIDSYTTTTEMNKGQDRTVKTSFTINLMGHIVPDSINTSIANMNKFYSKSAISFGLETDGNIEILNAKAKTSASDNPRGRFFDGIGGKTEITNIYSGLSQEEKDYIGTTTVLDSNLNSNTVNQGLNTIVFDNVSFLTPPEGFPALTIQDFKVFINGVIAELSAIDSIVETGNNLTITFNNTLGYSITSQMEIMVVGKLNK